MKRVVTITTLSSQLYQASGNALEFRSDTDHSEPQHGKDICHRILCAMKAAVRTFCNEGHDILTVNDMHIALKEQQVKGTTAAVCSVDE